MNAVRLIGNWLLMLASPLWLGFAFIAVAIWETVKGESYDYQCFRTGERWFWE